MKKLKTLTRIKIKGSLFLIVVFSLSFVSINLNLFPIKGNLLRKAPLSKEFTNKLKASGSYSDIYINGLPGYPNNWTWAVTQPWCTGSGTSIDPYIIDGHSFNFSSSSGPCLTIVNSRRHFIIRNCIFTDSHPAFFGLHIQNTTNGLISNNQFFNNGIGVYLYNCSKNTVSGNTVYENFNYGIYLDSSNSNEISGNTVYNHSKSNIYLLSSNHTTLSSNTIYDSKEHGIILDGSEKCTISNNHIFDNLLYGISLKWDLGNWWSDHNNITENTIYHNNKSGIIIDNGCIDINIWDNYIYDHTIHGIFIKVGYLSDIYGNWIYDNKETGINSTATSQFNSFYENVFVRNKKHAVDYGNGNDWNSTTIGNYWDNHTGPDTSPHDGIVDGQYNITGTANSIDYLPIAEDGAPRVNILSPNAGDLYNESAPSFSITITEDYLVSAWYTVNNSPTTYPLSNLIGTIDQTAWNALFDGNVSLKFYASDLAGHTGSAEVIVEKDGHAPVITIHSPTSGSEFGETPPFFNITVSEPNLDTIWYTLEGSYKTIVDVLVWNVSRGVWAYIPPGTATITIHANDTLGHYSSQSVTLTKILDVDIPDIWIGMDYLMTGFFIALFSGVGIAAVIFKYIHKKRY